MILHCTLSCDVTSLRIPTLSQHILVCTYSSLHPLLIYHHIVFNVLHLSPSHIVTSHSVTCTALYIFTLSHHIRHISVTSHANWTKASKLFPRCQADIHFTSSFFTSAAGVCRWMGLSCATSCNRSELRRWWIDQGSVVRRCGEKGFIRCANMETATLEFYWYWRLVQWRSFGWVRVPDWWGGWAKYT